MDDHQENVSHETPLHNVSTAQEAEELILQGASLSARNESGETPLLTIELFVGDLRNDAQKEGERLLGLIEVMAAHGADLNAQAGDGSLLHKVAAYFLNEMTLDDEGEKVFEKIIKRLVELGANVNLRTEEDGDTPLHFAQRNEWQDSCSKILLDCGADINAQNNYGETPLMKSILTPGSAPRAERLIEWGAKLDLQDTQGWTALHHAAEHNNGHIVTLLLAHGANPDIVNDEGRTAEQVGVLGGRFGVALYFKGTPPPVGEVDNDETNRRKRAELRGRITQLRDEVNRTEAACRAEAWEQRIVRWVWIAFAIVLVFFGFRAVVMSLVIMVGIIIYPRPLDKAIRYETASEICLYLSGELRLMMDSTENIEQLEGKLAAMLLLRDQVIRMTDGGKVPR